MLAMRLLVVLASLICILAHSTHCQQEKTDKFVASGISCFRNRKGNLESNVQDIRDRRLIEGDNSGVHNSEVQDIVDGMGKKSVKRWQKREAKRKLLREKSLLGSLPMKSGDEEFQSDDKIDSSHQTSVPFFDDVDAASTPMHDNSQLLVTITETTPTSLSVNVQTVSLCVVRCEARTEWNVPIQSISLENPQFTGTNGTISLGGLLPSTVYYVACLGKSVVFEERQFLVEKPLMARTSEVQSNIDMITRSNGVIRFHLKANFHCKARCFLVQSNQRKVGTVEDMSMSIARWFEFRDSKKQYTIDCHVWSGSIESQGMSFKVNQIQVPSFQHNASFLLMSIILVCISLGLLIVIWIVLMRNAGESEDFEKIRLLEPSHHPSRMHLDMDDLSSLVDSEEDSYSDSSYCEPESTSVACPLCRSLNARSATVCRSCNSLLLRQE